MAPPEGGGGAAASAAAGPGGGAAASESARGTTTLLSSPSAPAGGHGNGTTPSPCFLEDVLVEISERTAELCPKIIRGHRIEFLENRCLVLKCAGMRGVLMKDYDAVDDEGEDVSNWLGGDVDAMAGNDAMAGLTLWRGNLCPRGRLWSSSLTGQSRKRCPCRPSPLLSVFRKGSTTGC